MSVNFGHLRMHISRIRAEFERGTPPAAALDTLRLILERQEMADGVNLGSLEVIDGSVTHIDIEYQT